MNSTQAELFARSFQSQVARNPGAACITLPLLRELELVGAVNERCSGEHVVSHGQIAQLLVLNRLQARVRSTKSGTGWHKPPWRTRAVQPTQAHDTPWRDVGCALSPTSSHLASGHSHRCATLPAAARLAAL